MPDMRATHSTPEGIGMIEDKLKRDERIRLEALAQAVAHRQMNHSSGSVLATAREFESFIRGGEGDDADGATAR